MEAGDIVISLRHSNMKSVRFEHNYMTYPKPCFETDNNFFNECKPTCLLANYNLQPKRQNKKNASQLCTYNHRGLYILHLGIIYNQLCKGNLMFYYIFFSNHVKRVLFLFLAKLQHLVLNIKSVSMLPYKPQ